LSTYIKQHFPTFSLILSCSAFFIKLAALLYFPSLKQLTQSSGEAFSGLWVTKPTVAVVRKRMMTTTRFQDFWL
jgi:hypothetical protein